MRKLAAALGMGLMLASAACGSGGQPAGSIKVTLSDYAFSPKSLEARAGSSTFYLVNAGHLAHDFVILDSGGKRLGGSDLVQPGNDSTVTVKLDAGTYKVVCTQQGHIELGMVASLLVS